MKGVVDSSVQWREVGYVQEMTYTSTFNNIKVRIIAYYV